MSHLFIDQLQPGTQINEIFMVTQPVLRNTTRGDLYIAMFLSDRTGKANGRMWQATEAIYNSIPTEGFVQIRGKVELYQGSMQIIINDLLVVDADKLDLGDYIPRTEKNVEQMFAEVKQMLAKIKDTGLKALIEAFIAHTDLMQKFCTAPAAMQMHHNYLGGLLEHTHSMLNVATAILGNYPKLQADIVLAGVFWNDIRQNNKASLHHRFFIQRRRPTRRTPRPGSGPDRRKSQRSSNSCST